MENRDAYTPGAASGAEVVKDGDAWTLIVTRDLRHPPARVWTSLTDPSQLRQWAPFDADRCLDTPGPVRLTTVGTPSPTVSDTHITRADAPRVLEFTWGEQALRWQLDPLEGGGTRLTLWHSIPRGFIAMGAAGWHVCLDVLDHLLGDAPVGRLVGIDALQHAGWQRLHAEYAAQFGIEPPAWPAASDAKEA